METTLRSETPVLGSTRVEKLLPVALEQYRVGRLAEKRPPAPSTLNLEVRVILGILNFGEKQGIVRNPILRGAVQGLEEDQKTIYFEPDEWAAFIAAADSDPELGKAAPLWRLKLLTASRISEMVDLRWRDVDFERGSIAIRQRKTRKKGVKVKPLTLTPGMRAVLATVPRGIGDAPVFAYEGLPWDADRLRRYFDRTVGLGASRAPGRPTASATRQRRGPERQESRLTALRRCSGTKASTSSSGTPTSLSRI